MIRFLRLSLAALAALGAVTAQAPAQTFTLPEIGLQNSGACRQFAVRERDTQTMVPLGCIDTTSKKWTLSPEKLISDSVVAAGTCDTSQWTGYVGGTYSPQLQCYASKQSAKADIPFPAVVGIGPENFLDPKLPVNDQTYIQLAQNLIQSKTTQGNMRQESALVINFDSQTGAGPQTNHGQKAALYMPTLVRPGGGNTWVMNPAITVLDGVGPQSMYMIEGDVNNYNGPYLPSGGLGTFAAFFRTFHGFPITASELWSGESPALSNITIATTNGSNSVTFTGTLHVGDKVTGPGIPAYTYVATIGGSNTRVNATSGTAVLTQNATATATGVTASRETYGMINGHLYQGANLIRDNTFFDSTGSQNSIQIGGTHQVGVNTTLGSMPYAMLTGGGQRVCLNALSACMAYDTTNNLLSLNDNRLLITNSGIITASVQAPGTSFLDLGNSRGQALRLLDAGGALANYVTLQGNSAGFGPVLRAAGSDANVPLNLSGQGASPVQILGGLAVTAGINASGLPTTGTRRGALCIDTGNNVYVNTSGAC